MQLHVRMVLVLLGAGIALGALGQADRAGPGSREAGKASALTPWQEYVLGGKWNEGEEFFRSALLRECSAADLPPLTRLTELKYALDLCHALAALPKSILRPEEQKALAGWLIENADFSRDLLAAVGPDESWANVFRVVESLRTLPNSPIKRFSQLAIAFAIVQDQGKLNEQELRQAFLYFVENAGRMRINPATLPHELARYVVDSRRPIPERLWALQRYSSISEMDRIYGEPPYDTRAYLDGTQKRISAAEPTLENIRKLGGVCHERAVFASEVGKANGVPCVYIWSATQVGIGHAWIAYLKRRGEGWVWDRDSGRITDEDAAIGRIRDPQSGKVVPEDTLMLGLMALRYPAVRRREALAWCDIARLLVEGGNVKVAAVAARRSVDLCVHDPVQWQVYAEVALKGGLTPDQTEAAAYDFADRLKEYPGLACEAFSAIAEALGKEDPNRRLRLYDNMLRRYAQNTEVLGRIRMLQGRFLEDLGREDVALKIYADGTAETIRNGGVAIPLLDNAARLLLKKRLLKEALALHEQTFFRTREMPNSAFIEYTTRFQVGLRLAALKALAGDVKGHDTLLLNLCSHFGGSAEERDRLFRRLAGMRYSDLNPAA